MSRRPRARVDKKEIFRIFRGRGLWTALYTRIKLRICPLLAVEPRVPERGRVLDLGCGNGLFAAILKLGAPERTVAGIDLDEKKIALAREVFQGRLGFEFSAGDLVSSDYPDADVVTIIDVLYLIPFEAQEAILRKCRAALPPGGVLVLKDMDTRPRWKMAWNKLEETLAVKIIGFTLGSRFYFRGRDDYAGLLARIGFEVEIVPLHKGYGYPHILFLGKKRAG